MKKQMVIWLSAVGFVLLIFCSCGTPNEKPQTNEKSQPSIAPFIKAMDHMIEHNAVVEEVMDAKEALMQMFKGNRLPGLSPSDHGHASSGTIDMVTSNQVQKVTYPFSVTFDLDKAGETSTNHYKLLRTAHGSEWQLQRAWRTDEQGRPSEELKVK